MTITEKIIAAHCGRESVKPGELVMATCDVMLGHDVTAPPAISEFRKIGVAKAPHPERIVLVNDHFIPNKDIKSAQQAKAMREFAREQGVEKYYEVGRTGVCHVLLPQLGLVGAGDFVIGADSHTCTYGALGAFSTGVGSTDLAAAWATGELWIKVPETLAITFAGTPAKWVGGKDLILKVIGQTGVDGARYMAMEYRGDFVKKIPLHDRFTIANMAIEAGGKNGIFEPDAEVEEYLSNRRSAGPGTFYKSDPDCHYAKEITVDISGMGPQVACPSLPENVKPVEELKSVKVDQVLIGSCTNGWIEDLRVAASVIKGKKVHPAVRMIVIPATPEVYRMAMDEGLIDIFMDAEAAVSTPTCGPCLGGHMGILADGETAISTTNRNFVGRMGHPSSLVYLSNPAVAAASAITGTITHPDAVA